MPEKDRAGFAQITLEMENIVWELRQVSEGDHIKR
jgi:hypothetical protein